MAKCRICGNAISAFMTFGRMPLANGFLTPDQFKDEYFFELAPAFCDSCHTVQLVDQPAPEAMFHGEYAFFSQTSKAMAAHFERFANDTMARRLGKTDPFVVELGSNDGIMLRHFAKAGIRHLGIEPSANVAEAARGQGVNTRCAFFGAETAREIMAEYGQADIIQAANVMCHIPDLNSVAEGVALLLKPDGFLIFEDPYLGDVIRKTSYDQIYDEHVYVFSALSVARIFGSHGLELVAVEPQVTHGGSMRYVIGRKGRHVVEASVAAAMADERALGLDKAATYDQFRRNCEASKDALMAALNDLAAKGKRVVGYGATSKSTTVTQYCGITPKHVEFISDTTPTKQGKCSPGAHIPVKPYDAFASSYPDVALLFAWNHAQEIFAKEEGFKASGGRWLVYVPEVTFIP
ncbi:SAM-dependent methyltransferase [Paramagnetospirillum marisnigri]|uniref:SAM-dependent methyltransferase n=1 Tax=Paramagnetospirillum marisnigri TaxID=1285242 RepID=A0A178MW62_9PROT|nr:class I SAM-dependent methyltransferase [Paramagnetospirillum marisnigri]OAN54676.1 SAM-dependent methyltransferase [Paramagnetospirillum marisnigri]